MKAIITTYHGATHTLPNRVTARFHDCRKSVTVSREADSWVDDAEKAARLFLERLGNDGSVKLAPGWIGQDKIVWVILD